MYWIVMTLKRIFLFLKSHLYKKYKNRKSLEYFEIHLTDHCNLNCACCRHFTPLAEKKFMDIIQFKNDLERLSELSEGKIRRFRLLGGEPLLHPDIVDFIKIARKNFPKSEIVICTNGILLTKMPEIFWITCFENNIEINVSYYPISLDYTEINKLALKYKILLNAYIGTSMRKFINIQMDFTGSQSYKKNWYNCDWANGCVNLYEGKIYTCELIPHSKNFSKYFNIPLEITENDYIDIYKAKSMKEILNSISKPAPFCKYCRPKDDKIVEWHVSEKKINEWAK